MPQYTYKFTEGPVMNWTVDDSLYQDFKPGDENTSRWSGDQGLKMYQAWCL